MATGHLVDVQSESLPGDATLEVKREEPIAVRYQDPCGHLGPGLQRPWLREHAASGSALEALVSSDDGRLDVMQEDLGRAPRSSSLHGVR